MQLPVLATIMCVLLVGCERGQRSGEKWVLENYDAEKGYVFSKDGATYQAHCAAILVGDDARVMFAATPEHPLFENQCSVILRYMHKAIPLEAESFPTGENLTFVEIRDGEKWQYGFHVTAVK
jgi:hypothetical protein